MTQGALSDMSDRLPGGYEMIRVLGEGSLGRTLLCSDASGESQVAVNELHFQHLENWKKPGVRGVHAVRGFVYR
jgi:hypothetical protein